MSGLLDQAGLTAGSGLSNGAGLYKWGNFNPFDPTDLDPYLLFDTAAGSMIGTLENPTLDLDPSNQETLDVITATRSSVATRTLPDGTIALAPSDTVRVDYTQGEQLTPTKFQRIGYTDFSQGWLEYNNNTSASDGGGYNGNPSKVIEALNAYGSYRYNLPTQDGVTYCQSVYIKRLAGSGDVRLTAYNSGGTATLDITALISSEFTRVSFVFQGRSGGGDVGIGVQDYGSGDMEVEIAMPQVEEGTTASDFVANTTGSPLWIASPTFGPRVPMVLIEPSATNLVPNSSSFENVNGSVQTTGFEAPDGSNDAVKISNINGATDPMVAWSSLATLSPSTQYSGSIFVKGSAGESIRFYLRRAFGGAMANSLFLNVVLTGSWQRVEIGSMTTASDNNNGRVFIFQASSGTPADEVYIWGAQLEAGSVATSYIPNPAPISSTLNSVTSFEADGSVGAFNNIHVESIAGISGKEVEVEFEIFDYVSGTAACLMGQAFTPALQVGGSLNANGIYKGVVTADSNNRILFRNNSNTDNFTGKIRNIKVVEVDTSGTRAADDLVISGSAFSDFFNDSEGTIYTEFEYDSQPNYDYLYTIQQTGNDEIRANLIPTNTARVTYVVAGSNVGFVSSNPLTQGSLNRHAFSYKTDNFKLSVNGGAEDTDLTGTASLSPTYIQFGARYGSVTIPLYFKRLIYWPTHSDNL